MSHFVTKNDISKYTNLLMTIPSLGERWHFDELNTIEKVQIPISWSFGNFSFSHWSILEHFKQEWVTLLQSKISWIILICLWWFQVRWRRHFSALNTIKKVYILILWSFWNFSFSHWSIVEHFKQEWVTLV